MSDTQNTVHMERKKQLRRKALLNVAIIVIGLVLVVMFMQHMQQRYSEMRNEKTSSNVIASIIETLDENTEKVNLLVERYHRDNQMILNDIVTLFHTGRYNLLYDASIEKQSEVMQLLSEAIGGEGYLFITNQEGKIVLCPQEQYVGENLTKNGTISNADYVRLMESSKITKHTESGLPYHIIGTPGGSDIETYFYGCPLSDEYYLLYGVPCSILEEQYAALKNIGTVLSNAVVGKTGFVFAVDAKSGLFKYFNNGSKVLTDCNAAEFGLTADALNDNYAGTQIIDGVSYHCFSRNYQSNLYGEYVVISAVCSSQEIYENNRATIIITALTFLISAALCLFYMLTLQTDPDQLVYYDEDVLNVETERKKHIKNKRAIKNIKIMHYRGEPVYLKVGVAKNLAPIIVISLCVIYVLSWNAQTMIEISKGLVESSAALAHADKVFYSGENSSQILMNRYQNQYLSKLNLISYMLQENPDIVFNQKTDVQGEDSLHPYRTEDYSMIESETGNPIKSIALSTSLKRLAEQNGLDYLFIFDDHGRTIATNTEYWYFIISDDPEAQSHDFSKVIYGEKDYLIQEPTTDEYGDEMQYVGTVFFYYTLEGRGEDAGAYVSEAAYLDYLETGNYEYNGKRYRVDAHRGMIQGGIKDETVANIMESTKPEYLMHQMKVDSNGFMVLFDNSEDHVCLWSPREESVGKTAAELKVPEKAFNHNYKGFTNINGVEYFQNYFYENGYWIATTIPTSDLFTGRIPIAVITVIVSGIFFLILFLMSLFTLDSEEKNMVQILEHHISEVDDNGMVKMIMKDGREKYVRTAAARFTNTNVKWESMLPSQKLNSVFRWILAVVVLAFLVCVAFCDKLFGSESIISYIVHGNWEHSFNYFAYVAFSAMIICVFAVTSIFTVLVKFVITNMGTRIETIGRLILSVLKYGSVLFSIFYGLSLLGVSTAGLVTSASIMSIVIGLGSQSLISDILAGIFIVFEGSFRVGDIVAVDNFSGMVVDIGLRTTKIEDTAGNIKIFNNAKISSILNMTKKASSIKIKLVISYNENLEMVESLIRRTCIGLSEEYNELLEDPRYSGVTNLGDKTLELTVVAVCAEQDRGVLTKKLTREFYLVLRDNDVKCPYQQEKQYTATDY